MSRCSHTPLMTAILLVAALGAETASGATGGKIVHLRGSVDAFSSGLWGPAWTGQELVPRDAVRTGDDGWTAILMADESLVHVNRRSLLEIREVAGTAGWLGSRAVRPVTRTGARSHYRLGSGEIWLRNNNIDTTIEIETPTVSAAIRGTELDLALAADGTSILSVLEGQVLAWTERESLVVMAGEQLVAAPGAPLQKRLLLAPEDAVQWTIPLPALPEARVLPPRIRQARLALASGRIREAQQILREVTADRPDQAQAWSLLALAHLAMGEKAQALAAARAGAQADPGSPQTWLPLSYAQQAGFDLEAAVESTKEALAVDPEHVPSLVNLAKLRFAMDYPEEARTAVTKAIGRDPDHAEARTMQGFLELARRRVDVAKAAFKVAVALDRGSGEPHLGLALCLMRQGEVEAALEEIATAVLLEPRRSLFLSYWAKMLYQVRRFEQALDALAMAAILDPQDPTPELYRSLILRDLNRAGESIDAMNRAVALNDNRAVYRSRSLLDKDLAVKNVGLAILYDSLGLSAWAFRKATLSVTDDYLNPAGHLFLAGALAGLEGRNRASESELLQAQLLQPANLNTFNQFNEYTSFFEKPSLSGILGGRIGNHGVFTGSLPFWGNVPGANLAFEGAIFFDRTEGWRDTNHRKELAFSARLKWEPVPRHSFFLSGQAYDRREGEWTDPRFEFDKPVNPDEQSTISQQLLQAGYHYHLSPRADLLLVYTRSDLDGDLKLVRRFPFGFVANVLEVHRHAISVEQPYDLVQGQLQAKWYQHQLIFGLLHYWGRFKVTDLLERSLQLSGGTETEGFSSELIEADLPDRFTSAYLLNRWKLSSRVSLEAGLYLDDIEYNNFVQNIVWDRTALDPRLGLSWSPTDTDTLRLAAFQYVVPHYAARIDPTHVAGVTIFRNALEGTLAREADLVWEHEWSRGFLLANLFYLEREVNIEEVGIFDPVTVVQKSWMRGGELIYNQLVSHRLGLAARYRYLDVDDEGSPRADRRDHLASLQLTFLHPWGVSAAVQQTYRYQDFKAASRDNEDLWITDFVVGYELPQKKGFVQLAVNNVFDQHFNWVTDSFVFQGRVPAREIILTTLIYF